MKLPIILYCFFSMLLLTVMAGPARSEQLDGAQLYMKKCAKCHNDLSNTTIPGRRAQRIKTAIKANIGGMSRFSGVLNDEEIAAIAEALARNQKL